MPDSHHAHSGQTPRVLGGWVGGVGCYSGRNVTEVLVRFFLKEAPRRYQDIVLYAWLHSGAKAKHYLTCSEFASAISSVFCTFYRQHCHETLLYL